MATVATDWFPGAAEQQTPVAPSASDGGWRAGTGMDDDVAIPRRVFEKTYLNPPIDVKGDFRNILANPTPLGLVGFLVATMPVSFALMGWGGAGGGGAATVGMLWFFGGLLQLMACVMEWILGNTFSFLVFGSFGAAWLSFAATMQPAFNALGAFTSEAKDPAAVAAANAEFNASFAFALVTFGLLTTTFAFCALRTNVIFVFCFALVSLGMFLFASSYWMLAQGKKADADNMQVAVGAIFFTCCVCAWYLLVANLLECLEFGISLPVGDLTTRLGHLGNPPAYRDRSKSV